MQPLVIADPEMILPARVCETDHTQSLQVGTLMLTESFVRVRIPSLRKNGGGTAVPASIVLSTTFSIDVALECAMSRASATRFFPSAGTVT
jgi:hypothetical protein